MLTDNGEKPIEDIQVGDKVLAKSDETGEVAYKEVVGLFQKQADEIIEVTGEHPFWLDGRDWTYVKDLKVGDLLLWSDGTKLAIDKIEKESREATVYNFEVEGYHSYFVSNLGIWVHNCDINPELLSGADPYGGYYQRKASRTQIYNATYSAHGYKHLKARNGDEAKLFSETGRKHAQYLPEVNNKTLEKTALEKGLVVQGDKGSTYFIYDAGKPVGYDLGVETSWIRAELTSGGIYHGHPIAGNRLMGYLKIAELR